MIRASSSPEPYRTAFTDGTHTGVADTSVAKGGGGQGFGPFELLEAALATCVAITVRKYAAEHRLPLTAARCEARVDRSDPAAAGLTYTLSLEGPLTAEQTARLRQVADRCPVARTLTGGVVIRPG
jgi:putative redox protein